jgi:proteasome accessory factor A
VHDKAGERILEQLLASAEQRLREEGIRGDIYLFKNNTDSAGNSYGCHENYLTSRATTSPLRRGAHPVPRQPPDLRRRRQGAADRPGGHVLHQPAGRAHLGGRVARPPPGRPIINTRDEPHADAERYRRLHVIVGDSNMSEYATFLKVGATCDPAAHARGPNVVPARHDPREPHPGHPRDQPRHHLHARKVRLANGREERPRHPVASTSSGRCATPSAAVSARRRSRRSRCGSTASPGSSRDPWSSTASATGSSSTSSSRPTGAHDLPLAHPKVALLDLQYHDVNRRRGLFYKMQDRGLVERICTDAEIDQAVEHPPQTTRARLRGEFIRRAKERKRDYTVDWVHLKLNDQAQRTVLCKDPFKAHDERVEKLIASL